MNIYQPIIRTADWSWETNIYVHTLHFYTKLIVIYLPLRRKTAFNLNAVIV